MPCRICRQTGHNRSTCPQRTNITGLSNNESSPPPVPPPSNPVINDTGTRRIKLINMRNENYLVYWVLGNYMIEDFDSQENRIKIMGLLNKKGFMKLKTISGHRFYLIPHRLDSIPNYHPQTDKEFIIEPYHVLNIHDDTQDKIFIDNKETLSELNKWKFNALKLDSETDKDIAGIPSTMTNIT